MRARLVLVVLLFVVPLVGAGNEPPRDASLFADHSGFNTQAKLARHPDGSVFFTYAVPARSGVGTEVVVVQERDGRAEELPRPSVGRGDISRPSLALDARGLLHVAWTERGEEDREVYAAWFDGEAWREVTQLSGGQGYAGFPSLAADGRGGVHVAWYGFDGTFYQTFYREWRDGAWLPAEQLSSGNLDANNPSLVVDAENGVHVAWYKSDGHAYRIWYAHRPAGGAWALPHRVSEGDGEAFNAALAVDRAGRVHAAWDELHEDGFRIRHAVRENGTWSAPTVVARGASAGEYPAITAWGDGVLVAWATREGGILASDLAGEPRPLLGGTPGRHPSLTGPRPVPAAQRGETLDVLWTEGSPGAYEVRHVRLAAGCSPFLAAEACDRDPAADGAWPGPPPLTPAAPTRDAPHPGVAAMAAAVTLGWLLARRRAR